MENLGHLMVDIETMGDRSYSVICSIGAVEFDITTGKTGRTFYERVSIQSCLDAGLKVTGGTIEWWLTKNESARQEVAKSGSNLCAALGRFSIFLKEIGVDDLQLWGNPARFDMGLLRDAYNSLCLKEPWKHKCERDLRTLVSLRPEVKEKHVFEGECHLPIDDCLNQIKICCDTYRALSEIPLG